LNRSVSPPDHSESSPLGESVQSADFDQLTANGSALGAQKGAAQFTTTHWSVVLEAQSESPAAQEALEKLCRVYWRPIYGFVQRQGIGPEEAKDVTQGFFADLLEHRSLTAVRKEKGRFRSYLLGALKYFLADERRRATAIKRGKGQTLIPFEELSTHERLDIEPADPVTAEQVYERRWASTVLERVLFQPVIGTDPDYVTITSSGRLGRSNLNGSSRRFKHDIQPMDIASEVIFGLRPVSFRYNKEYDATQRPSFGLIAEEVAEKDPDLIGRNKKGSLNQFGMSKSTPCCSMNFSRNTRRSSGWKSPLPNSTTSSRLRSLS
jgi:DNA-directed RNA polymerase specialized sigma24 family protein